MKKIAVEEAFATESLVAAWRVLLDDGAPGEAGLHHNIGRIINAPDGSWGAIAAERLMDLGEIRLRHMDEGGVDMQLIAITAPGVQVFDADTAVGLSVEANDVLAEAAGLFLVSSVLLSLPPSRSIYMTSFSLLDGDRRKTKGLRQ